MSERRTEKYKEEAIFLLNNLLAILDSKSMPPSIGEVANAIEKDRNFTSAFINACVGFGLCNIKKTNSLVVTLTNMGKKFLMKDKIILHAK